MKDFELNTHKKIARLLVTHPDASTLETRIVEALNAMRGDERAFWVQSLEAAREHCAGRGMAEAAAVLQALIESAEAV